MEKEYSELEVLFHQIMANMKVKKRSRTVFSQIVVK